MLDELRSHAFAGATGTLADEALALSDALHSESQVRKHARFARRQPLLICRLVRIYVYAVHRPTNDALLAPRSTCLRTATTEQQAQV